MDLLLVLALVISITFQGHTFKFYNREFMGNIELLVTKDDGLPQIVSRTSGNSNNFMPAVCFDNLFVVYEDDTSTAANRPSIRISMLDGDFWTSEPVPGSYGFSPILKCYHIIMLLEYTDGDMELFQTYDPIRGWSLPMEGLPQIPRSFLPVVAR